MKITQTWRRNPPSTISGDSITVTTTYYSFNKQEIDDLERGLPTGILMMDSEKTDKKGDTNA